MSTFKNRYAELASRLLAATGYSTNQLAKATGVPKSTLYRLLDPDDPSGTQDSTKLALTKFANDNNITSYDLTHDILPAPPGSAGASQNGRSEEIVEPNAGKPEKVTFSERLIPVFGQAVGGEDGKFMFNGEKVADVFCLPSLTNVRDAYAVFVSGESMEPRYLSGETVFVNPARPVRRGDFCVIQVHDDSAVENGTPDGYIKRYERESAGVVYLSQFNPPKEISFPRERVVSIHKIVGNADL